MTRNEYRAAEARHARYCPQCGRTLPGPLAERMHTCEDRPGRSWHDMARGGKLPARVEYIA